MTDREIQTDIVDMCSTDVQTDDIELCANAIQTDGIQEFRAQNLLTPVPNAQLRLDAYHHGNPLELNLDIKQKVEEESRRSRSL